MTIKPVEILPHPENPDNRIFAYESTREVPEDAGDRPIIRYCGSNLEEDRYGSVIDPRGSDTEPYMRSGAGVFCWGHDYAIPTIGKCVNLTVTKNQMLFDIEFATSQNPLAKMVYELVRDGFMPGSSIGFIPMEWEDYKAETVTGYFAENRKYTRWELLELSSVAVPANRGALKMALSKGVATERGLDALGLTRFMLGEDPVYLMRALANRLTVAAPPPAAASKRAAADEDEPEPTTPEEALKDLTDATDELMKLWEASDQGDDDLKTVMDALDAAEETIDAAAEELKADEEADKTEKSAKAGRSIGLRAAIKLTSEGLRDCWVESCYDTTYSYCPLCYTSYIGNPAEPACNCMEALTPDEAAAEQTSIGALIDANSATLDAALEAWDTAEHDALRNFASSMVIDSMYRIDRLLMLLDYWYPTTTEVTLAANIDGARVRQFVTAVQGDEEMKKRLRAVGATQRAGAEISKKNRQRITGVAEQLRSAATELDTFLADTEKKEDIEGEEKSTTPPARGDDTAAGDGKGDDPICTVCDCGECTGPGCDCCETCADAKSTKSKGMGDEEIRGHDENDVLKSIRNLSSLLSDDGDAGATSAGSKGSSETETPGAGSGESAPAWRNYLEVIMRTTKDE